MALTADVLQAALLQLLSGQVSTAADFSLLKDHMSRKFVRVSGVTDGGTAATDVVERVVYTNNTGGDLKVIAVFVTCPVAVTSSDTTNKVFLLQKRPASAPGTPATVNNADTSATGASSLGTTPLATAFTRCTAPAASFTSANQILVPGDALTLKTTHGSTGVAVAAASTEVDYWVVLEPVV